MDVSRDQLQELYVNQGLSVRACAQILGMPTHGRMFWLMKRYGIQARPSKFQKGHQVTNKGRAPEECAGWKGGKQTVPCDVCGKQLERFPSLIYNHNFCGRHCYGQWRATNLCGRDNPNYGNSALAGERNPNWQGGISTRPYCFAWKDKEYKRDIMERDGFECRNPDCRKTSSNLVIHHLDYDKKNCHPSNLVTLCVSCNVRANYHREFWQSFYRLLQYYQLERN